MALPISAHHWIHCFTKFDICYIYSSRLYRCHENTSKCHKFISWTCCFMSLSFFYLWNVFWSGFEQYENKWMSIWTTEHLCHPAFNQKVTWNDLHFFLVYFWIYWSILGSGWIQLHYIGKNWTCNNYKCYLLCNCYCLDMLLGLGVILVNSSDLFSHLS